MVKFADWLVRTQRVVRSARCTLKRIWALARRGSRTGRSRRATCLTFASASLRRCAGPSHASAHAPPDNACAGAATASAVTPRQRTHEDSRVDACTVSKLRRESKRGRLQTLER
jgi:hypothetical protein